jgi:hypothetical protein
MRREKAEIALVETRTTDARLLNNRRPYGYKNETFALLPGRYTFEVRRLVHYVIPIVLSVGSLVSYSLVNVHDRSRQPKTVDLSVEAGHRYRLSAERMESPGERGERWRLSVHDITEARPVESR